MKKLVCFILFFTATCFSAEKTIILTKDNTLRLSTYYSDDITSALSIKALELDSRLKSNEPLYLVLDSGGGSIESGISLINFLKKLNRPVHTISVFSASMAFQTVQGLGTRYITKQGTLMSHKARGGFYGEFPGQLDQRYVYYLNRVIGLDKIAAKRANMTLQDYHTLIENEFWCQGIDCVKKGFADEIVYVNCDKTLEGTETLLYYKEYQLSSAGLLKIELFEVYPKCPVIGGIVDWYITVNGSDVTNENLQNLTDNFKNILKNKAENKRLLLLY